MDGLNSQLLLTDALLLDAVEGIDSIADRLVALYDRWTAENGDTGDATLLGTVLTDLGWWRGRFEEGVSSATLEALGGGLSGGS